MSKYTESLKGHLDRLTRKIAGIRSQLSPLEKRKLEVQAELAQEESGFSVGELVSFRDKEYRISRFDRWQIYGHKIKRNGEAYKNEESICVLRSISYVCKVVE